MGLTRRQLLVGAAGAAAGAATFGLLRRLRLRAPDSSQTENQSPSSAAPVLAAKGRGLVVGAFQTLEPASGRTRYSLSLVDEEGRLARTLPLDFPFHGFAPDPTNVARVALFQKKGSGACEIDLVAGKVLRPIETTGDRLFYGHGVFSADGRVLYSTETVVKTQEGLIVVRDGRSLAVVGELPSHGKNPHDCLLLDDGKTLAITNGGGTLDDSASPPNVAFVDIASTKLLERVTFPDARINAGHLAVTRARDLVVVSAPRKGLPDTEHGGVTIRPRGAAARTMTEPAATIAKLVGETLSVAVHEQSGVAATTTPDGNVLVFWNLAQGTQVRAVDLQAPRGVAVTRDGAHFAVSHGLRGELAFFSTQTLEREPALEVPGAQMSGSHIYVWAPPAA
jgi:hypothetical protein